MNKSREKLFFYLYILSTGVGFYLAWGFFAAIAAPMLPQAENYCVEWYSPDGESSACGEFINDTEAFIHSHNIDMKNRNGLVLAILASLLAVINATFLSAIFGEKRPASEAVGWAIIVAFTVLMFNNMVLYHLIEMEHGWYPEIFEMTELARATYAYYWWASHL